MRVRDNLKMNLSKELVEILNEMTNENKELRPTSEKIKFVLNEFVQKYLKQKVNKKKSICVNVLILRIKNKNRKVTDLITLSNLKIL